MKEKKKRNERNFYKPESGSDLEGHFLKDFEDLV